MPTSKAVPNPRQTPSLPWLEPVHRDQVPSGSDARQRRLTLKHTLDRVGAAAAIVLALPLFLVAAVVVKLTTSGPVLIRERRIARDGRSFNMLAFPGVPILRRWSIDQLPQLVNVLRGQMSFVGPRPERPEFVELFGANLRRHDQPRRVRPGITGWSQLQELRRNAPLAERVRWDNWYVENWSLRLDLKIVWMTVRDVSAGVEPATGD
jgi:lipopolysaccharide/colanic/teichoic acid biosynthesis glycosyltransferase